MTQLLKLMSDTFMKTTLKEITAVYEEPQSDACHPKLIVFAMSALKVGPSDIKEKCDNKTKCCVIHCVI